VRVKKAQKKKNWQKKWGADLTHIEQCVNDGEMRSIIEQLFNFEKFQFQFQLDGRKYTHFFSYP
jgi:hypothetical protein